MDTMKTSQYLETIATFLSSKSCESSKKNPVCLIVKGKDNQLSHSFVSYLPSVNLVIFSSVFCA